MTTCTSCGAETDREWGECALCYCLAQAIEHSAAMVVACRTKDAAWFSASREALAEAADSCIALFGGTGWERRSDYWDGKPMANVPREITRAVRLTRRTVHPNRLAWSGEYADSYVKHMVAVGVELMRLRLDRKRTAEAVVLRIERWAKPARCTAEDFTF